MNLGFSFFFNSILLGIGLAMDAFSVSLANGLNEPTMKKGRMGVVAGVFSLFQFAMPMIGWICVSTIAQYFKAFEVCIPWIALILLCYIGGKMLLEGIRSKDAEEEKPAATADDAAARVAQLMEEGLSRKDAIKRTAIELDLPKNVVYDAALK